MSPQTNASKYARSSVPTTARAPHRSPFPHRTLHKQARRITMRVHTGRRLPTPQMISNKLLTALALLAQHAAALDGVSETASRRLDDLCAPASTSAARRARRTATVTITATQGSAPSSAVGRRDRGADGRADRAGLARQKRRNSTLPSKNPIWSKSGASLEPPALRIGCAPAYQWTGQRHGAWPWVLRRAACPRAAPEPPATHSST